MGRIFPAAGLLISLSLAAMLSRVPSKPAARYAGEIVGNVRVQFLSPTLVRLELQGPQGFEDRNTFTVVKRPKALTGVERRQEGATTKLIRGNVEVAVPGGQSLKGVRVLVDGKPAYVCDGSAPAPDLFPAPGAMPPAIAIADNPRIVPPKWGARPAPKNNKFKPETSGWDLDNQSTDIYVFLSNNLSPEGEARRSRDGGEQASYAHFRKEFLSLTGPIPLPPLYYFGFWHSRYHPYTDKAALEVIDTYRKKKIPLDAFVVDTDWRIGASHGYAVNTKLFPNMPAFIKSAHGKHVRLMYNDHPEPKTAGALDPEELQYRYEGLASLLNLGADVWWYDRNWSTHLIEPAGLPKEVWGAALFHDITQEVKPGLRPLIMSNVPGIDGGLRHYAPHPATHRYPVWWTGDTTGNWDYLKGGIANAVDGGVDSLIPYMSEDLGGHFGNPDSEVYTRFLEYGALSPMTRVHCTAGEIRDPWVFGETSERIVRDYVDLRYRLLPTIYSAARQTFEDGTPIIRRLDLEYPNEPKAKRNDQYLLGNDILIAPVLQTGETQPTNIPLDLLHHGNNEAGLKGEYYPRKDLQGAPQLIRVDPTIDFNWGFRGPTPDFSREQFSIRWTGKIGPMPETGRYQFVATTDDGCRLWIDDHQIIDEWKNNHLPNSGFIDLKKGQVCDLRLEYYNDEQEASARLQWILPSQPRVTHANRQVWIPPGNWQDLWTGTVLQGPTDVQTQPTLRETPMYVRRGSILFLAPPMQYTGQKAWDPITIEAFPGSVSVTRTLYEDDGISNRYLAGAFCKTDVSLSASGKKMVLKIGPAKGKLEEKLEERAWIVRLHLHGDPQNAKAKADGEPVTCRVVKAEAANQFPLRGAGAPDGEGTVVEIKLPRAPTDKPRTIEISLT